MIKSRILLLLASLLPFSSAQAYEWVLMGLPGYAVGETHFSGYTWGAGVDFYPDPAWAGGLYWTVSRSAPRTLIPIMFQVNYWHPAGMRGFYLGPRIGLTAIKTDEIGPTPSMSSSEFTWGAQLGYDHVLDSEWSIGFNANLNLVMSADANGIFNLVLPIKYRF